MCSPQKTIFNSVRNITEGTSKHTQAEWRLATNHVSEHCCTSHISQAPPYWGASGRRSWEEMLSGGEKSVEHSLVGECETSTRSWPRGWVKASSSTMQGEPVSQNLEFYPNPHHVPHLPVKPIPSETARMCGAICVLSSQVSCVLFQASIVGTSSDSSCSRDTGPRHRAKGEVCSLTLEHRGGQAFLCQFQTMKKENPWVNMH